jgi:hypothetical protein
MDVFHGLSLTTCFRKLVALDTLAGFVLIKAKGKEEKSENSIESWLGKQFQSSFSFGQW